MKGFVSVPPSNITQYKKSPKFDETTLVNFKTDKSSTLGLLVKGQQNTSRSMESQDESIFNKIDGLYNPYSSHYKNDPF